MSGLAVPGPWNTIRRRTFLGGTSSLVFAPIRMRWWIRLKLLIVCSSKSPLDTCSRQSIGLAQVSMTGLSRERSPRSARVRHSRPAHERPPQTDRHPHPIGPPLLGERLELRGCRLRLEAVLGADRPEQSRLACGQLVDSAERAPPDPLPSEPPAPL